uniref:G_PROTEIN_RECEP_F1_2 domain-containing protein n=1 Tax=Panagrellus redivivus TaxID=6233 RepID=A0A7E4ZZ76_PANRE
MAAAFSNCTSIIIVLFLLREKCTQKHTSDGAAPTAQCILPAYDRLALALCFLSKAALNFIMANFELIGTPFAMVMFALDRPTVIKYMSFAMAANCSISFVIYVLSAKFNIERKLSARTFAVVAFACFGGLYLVTFSWPFLPGKLVTYNSTFFDESERVGCNTDHMSWCGPTKPVNMYLFFITYIIVVGSCYTLLDITVNTLFTKIIGPRRQTIEHGYFQMAGGSSKLIAPICISSLYTTFGPRGTWTLEIFIIGIVVSLWIIMWKRMIPFEERIKCKCGCCDKVQTRETCKKKKCCAQPLAEFELKQLIPKETDL